MRNTKYLLLIFLNVLYFSDFIYAQEEKIKDGYNLIYYPNGKVSSEGTIRNGKPDGYWKTYYPSGILKSEGNRRNFLLDSVWVFYSERGDTMRKVNYILGKRNGFTLEYNTDISTDPMNRGILLSKELFVNDKKEGYSYYYYKNGKLKEEIPYSNNKKRGIAKEFDENGMIITLLTYKDGYLTEREKINRKDDNGLKQGVWRDYYENGVIKSEANYVNDLLNGSLKEFDSNGNIKLHLQYAKGNILEEKDTSALDVEIRNVYDENGALVRSGSYKDSIPIGIHRIYDPSGKVINGYLYDNRGEKLGEGIITNEGKKEGEWKYFYSNDIISSSGKYINNFPVGNWKYFYSNGKMEQTGVFKAGKADGIWQWYFKDGKLKREEEFYEGKAEGLYFEYDTTGEIIVSGKYFDDQKEEEWVYKVGDYIEKGKYVGDLKDGKWQAFYADGKLKYEGNYIQGNPDGEHKFYFPNGQLKEVNYYVMGISEKNWRKYNENGELLLTITYKDNREFRINGEKVEFAEQDIKLIQ